MMDPKNINWGCCNGNRDGDNVNCSDCNIAFHKECLQSFNYRDLNFTSEWKCPECRMKVPKSTNNDNTPVRRNPFYNPNITKRNTKRAALSSPAECSPPQPCCLSKEEVHAIIKDIMHDELQQIVTGIKSSISTTIISELGAIKDEMKEIRDSMNFFSGQYDDFLKEHESHKKQISDLREQNSKMQIIIQDLKTQINSLEQRARSNNLELQYVPESKSENLITTVIRLSEVIGANISKDHINNCTRVAKSNRASSRPRNIVVQFSSPIVRDTFLASAIKFNKSNPRNKLNTSHIGLDDEKKPIFVSEHLSPANKALHAAARIKAKELEYKYVWIRNGKIFMRKNDLSDFKFIKDFACLEKLNG